MPGAHPVAAEAGPRPPPGPVAPRGRGIVGMSSRNGPTVITCFGPTDPNLRRPCDMSRDLGHARTYAHGLFGGGQQMELRFEVHSVPFPT